MNFSTGLLNFLRLDMKAGWLSLSLSFFEDLKKTSILVVTMLDLRTRSDHIWIGVRCVRLLVNVSWIWRRSLQLQKWLRCLAYSWLPSRQLPASGACVCPSVKTARTTTLSLQKLKLDIVTCEPLRTGSHLKLAASGHLQIWCFYVGITFQSSW